MGEKKRRATAGLIRFEGDPKVARMLREAQHFLRNQQLKDAKLAFERVLQLEPSRVDALRGLAEIALKVGIVNAGVNILAQALSIAPHDSLTRQLYAEALEASGDIESSVIEWQTLSRSQPENPLYWENLGLSQQYIGDMADAKNAYVRALELGSSLSLHCKMATLISPIISSRESMLLERQRMEQSLDALLATNRVEPVLDDPMRAALWTNFYLAYHGMSNKILQIKTAQMYRRFVPSLDFVAGHCIDPIRRDRKIKIGLISQFFYNHSIGRTSRGFFAKLSRHTFDVTAIFIAPTIQDEYSEFIRSKSDRSIVVPQDLSTARALIAEQKLDILFYQDIGMEPFGYFLAYSRLAPLQCVSFGHPDTTGIPTIDYFISNDLYEVPEAASHYSERLYVLKGLGTLSYYHRPRLPDRPKTRLELGLNAGDRIYLCPQNLFKLHPDMDELMAAILRRDPQGKIVMISGKVNRWTELLKKRWSETIPDVVDRIIFLPRMISSDYLTLIASSDVMLDTIHFNGMNTSLEAFSVGTPVVTYAGEFQRGRHTQAMYQRMGISVCIAETLQAYVDIAVRVATETAYREGLRSQILARCDSLFEDERVIEEFELAFVELLRRRLQTYSPE
jgi:predicted O-linked N-acetylglucosamine transferase (SPINDLY family)